MYSLVEENYLKALFMLADENGHTSVNDLSNHLEISMPTVNSMVKRLKSKDLVYYEKYKPLKLTNLGQKEAALIIRKHRLTEMFLVEKMGFGWEDVHDIAEQIEHIHSLAFFEKMDELLGHPTLDPHGSPIPDKEGNIEWKSYHKLSDCKLGEKVKLIAVINGSKEFLEFLNSRELTLNQTIEIKTIEAFDKSMVVSYENHSSETLSIAVCDRLLVDTNNDN